jgi:hypothetical protein
MTEPKQTSQPLSDYEREDRENKVMLDMLKDRERRRQQEKKD